MAELSLWLDDYDDIYSDFDSRHYLKRRISEDFLHELHVSIKYKKERSADLVLLLPEEKRVESSENIIIRSLKDFFTEQLLHHDDKFKKKLRAGIMLLVTGLVVMALNSFISFKEIHSLLTTIVKIILEPAGWFFLWLSFDYLLYDLRDIKKDKDLFKELSKMNIHFKSA